MNCDLFARVLADFQEGRLRWDERTAAEAHLAECDSCRRLLAIAHGKLSLLPEEMSRELARSIIERTSGRACPRVTELLCSYIDGELGSEDSGLITAHLSGCTSCRALADELALMATDLPRMAEIYPDAEFTRSVLGATSEWRPFRPSLRTRFLTWWNQLTQRPRFSFEAAYVGTLALVFVFGNPAPALRSVTAALAGFSLQTTSGASVSKNLVTGWTDAEAPVLRLARTYVATASRREQVATEFLKDAARHCEQMIWSAYAARSKSLDGWRQTAVSAFQRFWSGLTARVTHTKA
jgi:anti-sigma factor RsiW